MNRIWILILCAAGAAWGKPPQGVQRDPDDIRLSWSRLDYLEKGFRNAPWVKDPFYPENNAFRLSGLISNEQAFINGQWYRRGDRVEGFVVRDITRDSVTLTRFAEVMLLKLED